MPSSDVRRLATGPDRKPPQHCLEAVGDEPLSFVELVLLASEHSEDESEVGDLVDLLFESDRLRLRDLREDRAAYA